MKRTKLDLVGVVEAAYRLRDDDTLWLKSVLESFMPGFAQRGGASAALFEREQTDPTRVISATVNHGMDDTLMATMRAGFEHGTAADRDRSLRQGGPIMRFSSVIGGSVAAHPMYAELARRLRFDDLVVLRSVNPDGTGAVFVAPVRGAPVEPTLGRWPQIAAHIAAGLRLRRRGRDIAKADAVLDARGELVDGSRAAIDARSALRNAVRRIERASARRDGSETAIDAWTALVDGRWSLVDHFESDGKRFLLAMVNEADAPDPRVLSRDERPILHLTAMGHTNKVIAYELGIPQGTVATRLASVMRKLGVRTRVEIIERYTALRSARALALGDIRAVRIDQSPTTGTALTPAEAAVAKLAARGESNKRIATKRNCSERTVGNLLARVYAKLGVSSRAKLALALGAPARE